MMSCIFLLVVMNDISKIKKKVNKIDEMLVECEWKESREGKMPK